MRMKLRKMLCLLVSAMILVAGCGKESKETYVSDDDNKSYRVMDWDYQLESDVVYGNASGQELKLDVYRTTKEGDNPAIILLHGGGLTSGDKAGSGLIKSMAMDYAKMGYVVVVPNYRLSTSVSATALNNAMEDAKTAYEWVVSNGGSYGVDTKHIAVGGYSSGADIAINMCYTTYFTNLNKDSLFCVIDISGGSLHYSVDRKIEAGCVIVHGTQDTTVAYEKSKNVSENLQESNIDVLLHPMEGLNHILLSRYDEVRNVIAEYMYKRLTGKSVDIDIKAEISPEYQKVLDRMDNKVTYNVPQLEVKVDGLLDEWKNVSAIKLDKLKDAGSVLPEEDDFSGEISLAWNYKTPTKLYIAAKIRDDEIKDTVEADGKWYQDDCLEIVFDMSKNNQVQQFTKWVIGADGKDMSVLANAENTQVAVVRNNDCYVYEISIDVSGVPSGTYQGLEDIKFEQEQCVGFSISYNDGEAGGRQHQIGWTSGKSSDRTTLGTLNFQ